MMGWERPFPNNTIHIHLQVKASVIHVGHLTNLRLLFHLLHQISCHPPKTLSKACSVVTVQVYHDALSQSWKRQCGQELNQKSALQSERLNTSCPPSVVPVWITMQGMLVFQFWRIKMTSEPTKQNNELPNWKVSLALAFMAFKSFWSLQYWKASPTINFFPLGRFHAFQDDFPVHSSS